MTQRLPLLPVFVPLCRTTPGKLLLLLFMLLAPMASNAQSPELVQAKARVKVLNKVLETLDETIEQELRVAIAKEVNTRPKGEFETTAEYQARLAAAEAARQRLEPEYERKKADRRRTIQDQIESLTSQPYPAPIRIRLGTYDADTETFHFYVRATGDSGTIEIPREVAKEIRTNLPTLKQTGWWQLLSDGTERLAASSVLHPTGTYIGLVFLSIDATLLRILTDSSGILSLAFSPDGKTLYSASIDQTEKVWRVSNGQFLMTRKPTAPLKFTSPEAISLGMAYATYAITGANYTIEIRQVSDGGLLKTLEGHSGIISSLAFSYKSRMLASGSFDKTIRLWQLSNQVDDQFLAAIRSGAGGAVAAKGPSLPPALAAAVNFTEPSGNNILDTNEGGTLEITLTNTGQGSAYGVEIALSGRTPGLSIPARRYVGEIPAGDQRQVSIPLKAGLDLPDGQATLTCTFSEANGFEPDPIEITFETRAYRPPQLAVADVGVDEPSGNGMIEPGEVVTVMVRVQNRGAGAAEGARARVNIGKNVFAAADSETEFNLGTLPPGVYQDLQFQIYTNRRAKEIPVTVTVTERHGRYGLADAPLELPFNQPVRSIQQVVVEGKKVEAPEVAIAGGLSVDIERDIPQGRDQRRNAMALIIANRRYLDPDVPDVTFAHRDGEFVKQYLVRTLGYREGNIFLYQDATLSNFRTALQRLKNAVRKGSDVFVYYTGHGAPDPEDKAGYFVPVDCDPNYVKIGGVALEEFYTELGEIRAGNVTVVIDACFSGASEAGMLMREASPVFISVEDPAAGLKEGVVLTSASGDQISSWHTEQKHSLYTYYFLKGLQGAADQNGDRSLSVGELQAYLEEQVPYMARRLHNRTQTPTVTPGREDRVLVRYE